MSNFKQFSAKILSPSKILPFKRARATCANCGRFFKCRIGEDRKKLCGQCKAWREIYEHHVAARRLLQQVRPEGQ